MSTTKSYRKRRAERRRHEKRSQKEALRQLKEEARQVMLVREANIAKSISFEKGSW